MELLSGEKINSLEFGFERLQNKSTFPRKIEACTTLKLRIISQNISQKIYWQWLSIIFKLKMQNPKGFRSYKYCLSY